MKQFTWFWLGKKPHSFHINLKMNMLMIENWKNTEKHKEKTLLKDLYTVFTFYT